MSEQTFSENISAIRVGLKALLRKPESRKRYRLAALYEKDTGELMAEIFRTEYGPVVVHDHGLGLDYLFDAPLTGEPEQLFDILSQHTGRRHWVTGGDFMRWKLTGEDPEGGMLTFR